MRVGVFVGVSDGIGGGRVGDWGGDCKVGDGVGGIIVKVGVTATIAEGVGDEGRSWESRSIAPLDTTTRTDTMDNSGAFRAAKRPAGGVGVEGG
jgi:hypothetical protein